ncbi:MAG: hypothetical protein AAGC81_16325 [Pseudomonadota bacterium]
MMTYFEKVQAPFRPTPGARRDSQDYSVRRESLAFSVGAVAFGLPVIMLVGSWIWDICRYDSISHYYYSIVTGDIFVGALFFIGAFLWAYQGESKRENQLAKLAGTAAVGVALFPTTGHGCDEVSWSGRALLSFAPDDQAEAIVLAYDDGRMFRLFDWVGVLHFGSAAVLFVVLAIFCFFIFTIIDAQDDRVDGEPTVEKLRRNRIYICSGWAIVGAVLLLGLNAVVGFSWWDTYNLTFWMELLALWAFGISWALKGRFGPFEKFYAGRLVMDERRKKDLDDTD